MSSWLVPWTVLAQSVSPDMAAQQWLRDQERERALRQQQELWPDVQLEHPPSPESTRLPKGEVPCFPIQKIELIGDAAERFQWALQAADLADDVATGSCLGTAGVNLVIRRVQNALVRRGYITTRVLVAQQDLKRGVLTLTVVPGRVRTIRFSQDSRRRATLWNAMPLRQGDILNLRDIEQGLENFKRIPTVDADIQIAPAAGPDAQPGDSDLAISWTQRMPFRFNVSLDDAGSKYTGKYQGSVTFAYDHWLTLNDLFYATVNHDVGGGQSGSKGTRGYLVHYDLPYGAWLLGFTLSGYEHYQSVAELNQISRYGGTSQNSDVRLSRLLHRDAVRKTSAYLRGWSRSSRNFINDTEIGVQQRRTAGWEAGLTHRAFWGAAVLDASVGYRRGTGAFNALQAPEEDLGGGMSRPELVIADAQLHFPFTVTSQRLHYTASWRAQWSRTPLVPQDRFSIGGRYTVRGFDGENTLLGDRGWLIRNDLGLMLGNTAQQLYLGADYGQVSGPVTQDLLGSRLAGAVIGLRGGYKTLSWDVFAGRPLSKPAGFRTASVTAGFYLNWSY